MLETLGYAAAVSDCSVETNVSDQYAGYRFRSDDLAVNIARDGLRAAGFEPYETLSGGAADANVLNEAGLPCVNLANGMADIHTPDEHIAVTDLEAMVEVTLGLVEAARSAARLRRGIVSAILERRLELIRLAVDGVPCVAYPHVTGPVEVGDDVLVNEQARLLELAQADSTCSANLTRGRSPGGRGAHVMILPYTPVQAAVRHVEEEGPLADDLAGMPVVCCSLHSQLACRGPRARPNRLRPAGRRRAALSLSDTVRELKERGLLEVAVAVAPCHDGDAGGDARLGSRLGMRVGIRAAVCAIGPASSGRGRLSGMAASPPRTRPTPPQHSAADLCSLRGSLWPTRASATEPLAPPVRCCASASGTSRLLGPRAWSRRTFQWKRSMSPAGRRRASGCRCRTWVAAPRRIRGSSPRRSRPGGWRVGSPRVEARFEAARLPPKADAFSCAPRIRNAADLRLRSWRLVQRPAVHARRRAEQRLDLGRSVAAGQDVGGQAEVAFQQDEWLVAARRAHDERGPGLLTRSAAARKPSLGTPNGSTPSGSAARRQPETWFRQARSSSSSRCSGCRRAPRARAARDPGAPSGKPPNTPSRVPYARVSVSSCRRRTFSAASERVRVRSRRRPQRRPGRASARPTASSNRDEPSSPRRKIATISSSLLGRTHRERGL